MLTATRTPIAGVVQQHAEEAALLRSTRAHLETAPHVRLHHLRRIDDRIAAHLDGLAVAGEHGWRAVERALDNPGAGAVFAATARAIEDRNAAALDKLLALAETLADARRGLVSAFGWVSAHSLRGITKALLDSPAAFRRQVGLAACAMHQVDPGAALAAAVLDADAALRRRALRCAGEQGRIDLLGPCLDASADPDASIGFCAARSAVLLGDRDVALAVLQALGRRRGPLQTESLRLWLRVVTPPQAQGMLKALAQDPAQARVLITAVGVAGDPHYVPWLVKQMDDLKLTRLAGESFSMISGVDLAALDLERKPPEGPQPGPNDDPNDADVSIDEDDSLPWPEPQKVAAWWQFNRSRFMTGTRYFLGEPPTPAHCGAALKNGFQRQRIAAALYGCLLTPGTPLFGTAAPAWRQQRKLDALG